MTLFSVRVSGVPSASETWQLPVTQEVIFLCISSFVHRHSTSVGAHHPPPRAATMQGLCMPTLCELLFGKPGIKDHLLRIQGTVLTLHLGSQTLVQLWGLRISG